MKIVCLILKHEFFSSKKLVLNVEICGKKIWFLWWTFTILLNLIWNFISIFFQQLWQTNNDVKENMEIIFYHFILYNV